MSVHINLTNTSSSNNAVAHKSKRHKSLPALVRKAGGPLKDGVRYGMMFRDPATRIVSALNFDLYHGSVVHSGVLQGGDGGGGGGRSGLRNVTALQAASLWPTASLAAAIKAGTATIADYLRAPANAKRFNIAVGMLVGKVSEGDKGENLCNRRLRTSMTPTLPHRRVPHPNGCLLGSAALLLPRLRPVHADNCTLYIVDTGKHSKSF